MRVLSGAIRGSESLVLCGEPGVPIEDFEPTERRVGVGVVEDVEGVLLLGRYLEQFTRARVEDGHDQLAGRLFPEERDLESLVRTVGQFACHGCSPCVRVKLDFGVYRAV